MAYNPHSRPGDRLRRMIAKHKGRVHHVTPATRPQSKAELAFLAAQKEWLRQPMKVGYDSEVYRRYQVALQAWADEVAAIAAARKA